MILVDSIHLVAFVCALAYRYVWARICEITYARVRVYVYTAPSFIRVSLRHARGKPRKPTDSRIENSLGRDIISFLPSFLPCKRVGRVEI